MLFVLQVFFEGILRRVRGPGASRGRARCRCFRVNLPRSSCDWLVDFYYYSHPLWSFKKKCANDSLFLAANFRHFTHKRWKYSGKITGPVPKKNRTGNEAILLLSLAVKREVMARGLLNKVPFLKGKLPLSYGFH